MWLLSLDRVKSACKCVNEQAFTDDIQKEENESNVYDLKFKGNSLTKGLLGEKPVTVRWMLVGLLKHLNCVGASFHRSFIATEPLNGHSYNRPTCRKFRTAVRGSSIVIPRSPISRQVFEWLLLHSFRCAKESLSAPIACVDISDHDKLQLVDGAELRQNIHRRGGQLCAESAQLRPWGGCRQDSRLSVAE